jgi:hypothetical protein
MRLGSRKDGKGIGEIAITALIDRLNFLREHRPNAGCFKNFPAPTVRSDFDDRSARNRFAY